MFKENHATTNSTNRLEHKYSDTPRHSHHEGQLSRCSLSLSQGSAGAVCAPAPSTQQKHLRIDATQSLILFWVFRALPARAAHVKL